LGGRAKTVKLITLKQFTYSAPLALCRVLESTKAIETGLLVRDSLAKAEEEFAKSNFSGTANHIRKARSVSSYDRSPELIELWTRLYHHLPHNELKGAWDDKTLRGHADVVRTVSLNANGRFALSGSDDQTLKLWETDKGECVRSFEGHTDGVNSVCISGDAKFALSGSGDKTLKLWDTDTG
jgi:WD40 repeat protein